MSTAAIATALNVGLEDDAPETITMQSEVRLTRSGRAMRLVQSNGAPAVSGAPNPSLVKLLIKARRWWARLQVGDIDIKTLGRLEGVQAAYITRVVRLAFLLPTVVEGILAGRILPVIDGAALTATDALAPIWREQEAAMLPRSVR